MHNVRIGTLTLAVLALSCVPALSAEKWVPEEGAVRVALLRHKSVRDELKLTDAEAKKIHDFTDRQWEKAQRLEDKSAADRDREFALMSQENDQFLKQNLQPQQLNRLNQITLQTAGLLWVTYPEIATKIGLTEQQKSKARDYVAEARKEMQDLLHAQNRTDRNTKLKELRETNRKRLMDLLTDEQEARWKQMAGEPFRGEILFQQGGQTGQ